MGGEAKKDLVVAVGAARRGRSSWELWVALRGYRHQQEKMVWRGRTVSRGSGLIWRGRRLSSYSGRREASKPRIQVTVSGRGP